MVVWKVFFLPTVAGVAVAVQQWMFTQKKKTNFYFFFHFFAERSSWGMLLRSTRKAAMAGSEKKIPTVSVIYQPDKTGGTASSSTGSSTRNPSASYSRAANARYVPGHGLWTHRESLFFKNPKLLGLGRRIGPKIFGEFGYFY